MDLPEPVLQYTAASRPETAAATTSSWPARNASWPKNFLSVAVRDEASAGSTAGGTVATAGASAAGFASDGREPSPADLGTVGASISARSSASSISSSKRIAEGDDVACGRLVDARVRRGVRARGCAPWRGGGDAELGTRRIEKQKRGHSSRTLLSACPPNSGSNSFACVPGSNRRPRRRKTILLDLGS